MNKYSFPSVRRRITTPIGTETTHQTRDYGENTWQGRYHQYIVFGKVRFQTWGLSKYCEKVGCKGCLNNGIDIAPEANSEGNKQKTPLSTTSGNTTESQAKPANWRDLQASTSARSGLSSDPKNDPVERIVRRGPHGSPVRDHLGYELDYDKVMKARRGLGRKKKRRYGPKYENIIDNGRIEEEKKRMIMGTSKGEVSATTLSAWQDRVSRDLGVPYHMIEMGHFEEWRRKGFKADPGEFEAKNISEADDIRYGIRLWVLRLGWEAQKWTEGLVGYVPLLHTSC